MFNKTIIIAEAGVNHNGDIETAHRLVDAAVMAGADIIKFQTFSADRLVTRCASKADYQVTAANISETQYEMLRRLELSPVMHDELIAHCKTRGIEFMSTAFDEKSVDFLAGKGMRRFKIPSGEITNLPYLRLTSKVAEEVIISTGMATMEEICAAITVFDRAGFSRERLSVLHCTSEYPAPMEHVNLRAMQTIRNAFDVRVGYSDHTLGIEVGIAAVALGASIIEKHFTLDCNLPGPDHKASLEPQELKAMVSAIRNIEKALGNGIKTPTANEKINRSAVRKSLVATRAIKAGELLCAANVSAKRPGNGISPMQLDEVLGKPARRDFSVDEMIEL